MRLRRSISRAFTLLEIVVALSLIALGAGVIFTTSRTLLHERALTNELALVHQALRTCSELAIATERDWIIELEPQGRETMLRFGPEWAPHPTQRHLRYLAPPAGNVKIRYASTGSVWMQGEIPLDWKKKTG